MNGASRWLEAKALPVMASNAAATTGAARSRGGRSNRMSFLLVLLNKGRVAWRGARPSRSGATKRSLAGFVTWREIVPDANASLTACVALACIRSRVGVVGVTFSRLRAALRAHGRDGAAGAR